MINRSGILRESDYEIFSVYKNQLIASGEFIGHGINCTSKMKEKAVPVHPSIPALNMMMI